MFLKEIGCVKITKAWRSWNLIQILHNVLEEIKSLKPKGVEILMN